MNDLFGLLVMFAVWVACVGAFVQHLVTCIQNEAVLLLTVGVIIPPIGVLHGLGVWLGIFG